MKTSAIEVHDMLSVLSVDEVEKRIGEVPGVQSVTVNFAAGNATVRYDETQLEASDIKSAVRQRGHDGVAPAVATPDQGHAGHASPAAPPESPASASASGAAAAEGSAGAAPAGKAAPQATPDAPPSVPPAAPSTHAEPDKAAAEKT
jgi:copper chaperone CopZ